MILLALAIYFALIITGTLLALEPRLRDRMRHWCRARAASASMRICTAARLAGGGVGGSGNALRGGIAGGIAFVRGNALLSTAAFALVAAPPLLALALRGPVLFSFDGAGRVPDRQISILLEGEQLVPPLPLPPDVFTTREVEQVRPDVGGASREWSRLDEQFSQRLLLVFKLMRERHGYQMVLVEGLRSPERQARLAALGSRVTRAAAFMSYHQYGLAADCAFLRDGRVVVTEQDPWAMRGYELYGQLAESVGLTWGGRWQMRDLGHVELTRPDTLGRPLS